MSSGHEGPRLGSQATNERTHCAICGDPADHGGAPHGLATGDGLSRAGAQLAAVLRLHSPSSQTIASAGCRERRSQDALWSRSHVHADDCFEVVVMCAGCGARYDSCATHRVINSALYLITLPD